MNKDIAEIVAQVRKAGWRVDDGKHYKCYSPDGVGMVTVSKTPSSRNAVHAIRSDFKRHGLDLSRRN